MSILDEELLKKIRFSSECQASAKQYRGSLLVELVWNGLASTLLGTIIFFAGFTVFYKNFGTSSLNMITLASFGFGIYYFFKLLTKFLKALLDLLNNKLDITQDVFLSLYLEEDQSYAIVFKYAGSLPIIRERLKKFPKNTDVYVIRAAYSKNLLDLIPIDTV
jgi:hypothetical protein